MLHYVSDTIPLTTLSKSHVELLLESITKFITKLLSSDINYPVYLQEWLSFQEIIRKDPINQTSHDEYVRNIDTSSLIHQHHHDEDIKSVLKPSLPPKGLNIDLASSESRLPIMEHTMTMSDYSGSNNNNNNTHVENDNSPIMNNSKTSSRIPRDTPRLKQMQGNYYFKLGKKNERSMSKNSKIKDQVNSSNHEIKSNNLSTNSKFSNDGGTIQAQSFMNEIKPIKLTDIITDIKKLKHLMVHHTNEIYYNIKQAKDSSSSSSTLPHRPLRNSTKLTLYSKEKTMTEVALGIDTQLNKEPSYAVIERKVYIL